MKTETETKSIGEQIEAAYVRLQAAVIERDKIELMANRSLAGMPADKFRDEVLIQNSAKQQLPISENEVSTIENEIKQLKQRLANEASDRIAEAKHAEFEALKATLPELAERLAKSAKEHEKVLLEILNTARELNRLKGSASIGYNGINPYVAMGRTFTYRLTEGKPGQYLGDWAVIQHEVQP